MLLRHPITLSDQKGATWCLLCLQITRSAISTIYLLSFLLFSLISTYSVLLLRGILGYNELCSEDLLLSLKIKRSPEPLSPSFFSRKFGAVLYQQTPKFLIQRNMSLRCLIVHKYVYLCCSFL